MSIHQNLRQLRVNSGMTQEQVAEQLGVTRQALSSYESGRTRPDIDMLLRMCEVYHTDLEGIVYGENDTLRWGRWLKIAAVSVLALVLVLTMVSSALLWSAHTFFPLTEGQVERVEIIEAHFRLTDAWEMADGLVLTVALLGFLVLLVLSQAGKFRVATGRKLAYCAVLAAGVLLLPLFFALTDPVFSPINYLLTPLLVVVRMVVFLGIDGVLTFVKKRKIRRTGAESRD